MSQSYPLLDAVNPMSCISNKTRKCNRVIAHLFRQHLHPFGITNSQLSMLFVIAKAPEVTQKKLATVMYMEKSTVNRNLKRLLDHGWVGKSAHLLELTDSGKAFLESIIPHWEAAMEEVRTLLGQDGEAALDLFSQKIMN